MESTALAAFFVRPAVTLGGVPLTPAVLGLGGLCVILAFALLSARRALGEARAAADEAEVGASKRLDALLRSQAEITGRMQTMAEVFGGRQADLTRTLAERFDGLSSRLGQSLSQNGEATQRDADGARRAPRGDRQGAGRDPGPRGRSRAAAGHPRQQADPRGVRRGADAGDRRRRASRGRLCLPGDAVERQASGLPDPHAERRAVAGDRRQVSARSLFRDQGRRDRRGPQLRGVAPEAGHGCPHPRDRREVPSSPARRRTPPSCSCRPRRSSPSSTRTSRTSSRRRTGPGWSSSRRRCCSCRSR